VSAIDLPYEYSPFSMLVVLPAQSQTAQKLQAGLTPAALNGLIGHLANKPVIVSLPKFHITLSATSIIPQLKALGMKDAFSVGGADFSKLSTTAAYIGATYHAADIRVNEDGTIATAVTVVGVEPEDDAQPPQNAVHFDANRPFLFFLRDDTTGALLFAGRVDDPAAAQ
jgi:serpin B